MTEITPWVADNLIAEYKIDHIPPDKLLTEWTSNLRAPSTSLKNSICENCGHNTLITESDNIICGCPEVVTDYNFRRHSSQRSLTQEVLMKSALSAVLENRDVDVWYEEDETIEVTDNLRTRLSRMKEISRSESSLFQEAGHVRNELKEVHSDCDAPDIEKEECTSIISSEEIKSEIISGYSTSLPRSSAHVQRRKGHLRSKSDQIGVIVVDDCVDGEVEATAPPTHAGLLIL